MQVTLKNGVNYKSTVTKLSLLTALGAFLCILLGYIALPIAAAFYAALLLYEDGKKRIMSYVVPAVVFTLNFFLSGIYSLEAIAYVALGTIIYFCFIRGTSKGETAFWTALVVTAFMVISLLCLAFESVGSFSINAIKQYYSNLYINSRSMFVGYLTSLTKTGEDGVLYAVLTQYEAQALFRDLVISLVPIIVIIAFIIVGITLKLFSFSVARNSGDECGIHDWRFKTSNTVAYFYIIVAVMTLFSAADGGVFSYIVSSLDMIFMMVYAYIGLTFIFTLLMLRGKSPILPVIIIVILFVMLPSSALELLSYVGVCFNIIANKAISRKEN